MRIRFEAKAFGVCSLSGKDEPSQPYVFVPVWGPVSKRAPKLPKSYGPNPNGSVMTFKVVLDNVSRRPILEPAWISGDSKVAEPVAIAGGVVFALSSGENPQQSEQGGAISLSKVTLLSDAERKENTSHAVLYALDARTGRPLYESGSAMDTWVHFTGFAIAEGQVYAVDHDSQVYMLWTKRQVGGTIIVEPAWVWRSAQASTRTIGRWETKLIPGRGLLAGEVQFLTWIRYYTLGGGWLASPAPIYRIERSCPQRPG